MFISYCLTTPRPLHALPTHFGLVFLSVPEFLLPAVAASPGLRIPALCLIFLERLVDLIEFPDESLVLEPLALKLPN
ncbi:hypothetical protein GE09DRAFT_1161137 [Coniochaeta sp. 2T2.1]|nr:hypothetical protein GE09DRAFT_1161137 [Coniochaeta sp. 2T2.1]